MAKGADSEEFVVLSHVRAGLKREFAFALKVQTEICGSLGRTRSSGRKVGGCMDDGGKGGREKRLKIVEAVSKEEEANSDVVDGTGDDLEPAAERRSEAVGDEIGGEEELGSGDLVEDLTKEDEMRDGGAFVSVEEEEARIDGENMPGFKAMEEEGARIDGENMPGFKAMEEEGARTNPGKCSEDDIMCQNKPLEEAVRIGSECWLVAQPVCENKPMEEQMQKVYLDMVADEPVCENRPVEEQRKQIDSEVPAVGEPDKPVEEKAVEFCTEKSSVDEYFCKLRTIDEKTQIIESEMLLANDATFKDKAAEEQPERIDPTKIPVAEKPLMKFSRIRRKSEMEILKKVEPSVEEPMSEDKPLKDKGDKIDNTKPSAGEAGAIPVDDVNEVVDAVPKTPLRRFTRSALKPNLEKAKTEAAEERNINTYSPSLTLPAKVAKKFCDARKKFPAKLKDLLDTGILEGQLVRYIRGPKVRETGDLGLQGVIRGTGIVCHCGSCKGIQVVTPTVFELHAGSANKRPPEYIYLENGSTLRDVISTCQNFPLISLEEAVQRVIGCSLIGKCTTCFGCKGSMPEVGTRKATLLCNSCMELNECKPNRDRTVDKKNECLSNSSVELNKLKPDMVRTADHNNVSLKPVFTPKLANSLPKCNSSQSKSQGRITRKDIRLHKLVFEDDILPDGTEVAYYSRGQKLLVGYKMGSGIICSCCNSEVSPSQFEAHAGWASRRKPYLHIYTSNGVSLHELSLSLSRDRKFTTHENDDLCSVCQDAGDLLCCDGCPRAYHGRCINLPSTPNGTWYCKLCQNLFLKEKHVEHNTNALAAGRVPGIDSIEQITNRCIRIMNTGEVDFGGCALCGGHDFCKSSFGPRTVLFCDQCEKEFHIGCLKDHEMQDLKELPDGMWFCCTHCDSIHAALEKLVVHGEQKLPDTLLNFLKNKRGQEGSECGAEPDIKWRVLNGKMASDNDEETALLLSKAISIFHDQFAPITDSATRRDLIPEMLFGNSTMGQDFSRMYCAILTVNQCVVSAGIFRIYGSEMAELPLVATNAECQGKGYFQALFSSFERLLAFLNVKNLVLPAAEEAESIWTNKFGFSRLTQDELNYFRKQYQMMIFQGTSVLKKSVPKCRIRED